MNEKIVKWRSSPLHRRCAFCKWLRVVTPPIGVGSFYECIAKDKIIRDIFLDLTRIIRPFCRLYELDTEKRI